MQLPGWCASQVRHPPPAATRCSLCSRSPAAPLPRLQPGGCPCNLAGAPATPAASDPPGRCNLKASQAHNLTAHPLLTTDCICRLTTCLPLMTRRCSACNHLTPLPACSPLLSASADVLLTCTCTAHHQALILCGVALLMRKAHAGPKYNKDIKEVV